MENDPKVFIVVLNYNGQDCLDQTLRSVFRSAYPNLEIILVDNASTDGSLEMARQRFPKMIFIKNSHNLGFAAGNNVGIKYALERGAKYVMLLNNDIRSQDDFLSPLVKSMEENSRIGLASPVIFQKGHSAVWFSGGKINWWRMRTFHQQKKLARDYYASDFLSGCALLIRAEVFQRIGLLDEDYFLYWEDADFSVRARRAGYRLLVAAQSQIEHLEKSGQCDPNKIYWLVISGLLFFKKNCYWWWRPYIYLYTKLRRLKNFRDVQKGKGALALAVQRAYWDFRQAR